MPGFDGTGPRGRGSMTGGGRGFCAVPLPAAWPDYAGRTAYRPYGAPWGAPSYGAGTAAPGTVPFAPQMTQEEVMGWLKSQALAMKEQLEEIEDRIRELESKKE